MSEYCSSSRGDGHRLGNARSAGVLTGERVRYQCVRSGTSPQNAVIGITRGAVQTLTRDQLQGVIAHEFSHILNGDMRLNLRLIGLLHGILVDCDDGVSCFTHSCGICLLVRATTTRKERWRSSL